jgi:transcriptional regulator with XRE-family HTH domain
MNERPGHLTTYVGAAVRNELRAQVRTAAWLADQLGVSEMWISRRIRGIQAFDLNDVERIAAALVVPVGRLLPRNTEAA